MSDEAAKPRLVSLKAMARELGIPYTSMRECALRGEFPIIRIGRAHRVDRADIETWIRDHTFTGEALRGDAARATADAKRDSESE